MYRKIFWFVASLVFLVGTAWFCALQVKAQDTQPPLGDWSVYENEIWKVLMDEPEIHFQKAHELFMKKDYPGSASEIHKGSAFVKLEATRSSDVEKEALNGLAADLDQLADSVENGLVVSESDLKFHFARADQTMVRHHYAKATEYLAKNDVKNAGHELKGATGYLENAWKWSDKRMDVYTANTVKDLHNVYGKMIKGSDWTKDEVAKGMQDMGNEVTKLGKAIEKKK
ncbi:MAG: hypothetical protein LUQ65_13965 [Candidatus Helarchaeota archaeon]|nr:hypothetical protein [Candidatus Helarchaeota archaeon]